MVTWDIGVIGGGVVCVGSGSAVGGVPWFVGFALQGGVLLLAVHGSWWCLY